jgi:hypothetical protein
LANPGGRRCSRFASHENRQLIDKVAETGLAGSTRPATAKGHGTIISG